MHEPCGLDAAQRQFYRRQMLPVAPSASKAEAEAALRRVMSREARCPHGHR